MLNKIKSRAVLHRHALKVSSLPWAVDFQSNVIYLLFDNRLYVDTLEYHGCG